MINNSVVLNAVNHVGTMRVDNSALFQHVIYMLQQGKQVMLFVKGNSMYPFLHDGLDRVLLQQPAKDELTPGAIVLFLHQGKYLLHRIVRNEGTYCLMRGDNCAVGACERAHRDDILGVVKGVIRQNGHYVEDTSCEYRMHSLCWSKFPRLSRSFHRVGSRCARMIRYCGRKERE